MVDGKRGDSTMEVVQGEVVEDLAGASIDRVLGELEQEVARASVRPPKSIPPPLPRSVPPPPSSRSTLPAPKRQPTQSHRPGAPRSVPPPPPARARVSGLGRPATMPPPRAGVPTAPGIPAPVIDDAPGELEIDAGALREAALALAAEWEGALAEAKGDARRGRLAYELAQLHEGPLRDLVKASGYYRSALAATPDHLPSLRGARRVAIARKDHRAALPLFDAEARVTPDPRRKAALLYAKGRLLEDALGEKDEARELYATAAELDRNDASILAALEQRDQESGDAARLERTYEREANAVAADPRHRAALIVERARILEHRQQRVDAALELYETALRIDPRAGGALDAIERLCAAHGRHRELIHALERRAEESPDPAERALARYRVGQLHATELGNQDEAITALERAAAELAPDGARSATDPDGPARRQERPERACVATLVLEELAILYERAGRFEPLAEVLARLAERCPDPVEQRALWRRAGRISGERLDAPEDARRAYERALTLDPTDAEALRALSRIYEAAGAWDALVAMRLAEADEARDPERRAAAHARVAEVLERHGDGTAQGKSAAAKDLAITHHARALGLAPDFAASFKALARLYAETGKHRALVELHERAAERARERPGAKPRRPEAALDAGAITAIAHLFKIGAVQEDALGEHAQAAQTYRRILELDPGDLAAVHALGRAAERAGRHAELVDALEREAALLGAPASVALLTRAGEILARDLRDADGAIARFRRVLELDPRHGAARRGLAQVLHRTGRWEDLLELHRRELALDTKPDDAKRDDAKREKAALLHAMGQLSEAQLGDEAQAIDCYRRAIAFDPGHRPARTALATRLAARRDHAGRAEVLEGGLERIEDPAARARAAFRVGEIHEQHLGAHDRAMAAYEAALSALPGFLPASAGLARIRAAEGTWRRLVDQLEQEAANAEAPEQAVAKLARAGELFARALGDPRRAADCYERALALAPRHLESLLALARLYTKLGRHDALARTYGTLARVLLAPSARVAALRELARLEARGGGDAAELRAIHEAILGLVPDDPSALEALEALALEAGDASLLAQVDRALIRRAGDPKTAAAYQSRLAASLEAAGDASALAAYRAALESDPENMAAAKGLARVAAVLRMPEAVALAARREAAMTPEPRLAAQQLVRAAKVAHAELGQTREAVADYERALELWPEDADAAAGLTELLLSAGQAARAVDRLGRAAAAAKRTERGAALWLEVARLQAGPLENLPGALTSLGRVLERAPNHIPALQQAAALYARQRRWQEAAALLAKVVSLAPDRDVLEAAHLELARLWAEHLGDLPRALVSLQAVLALDAAHPEALRRLADVAARSGDRDKAVATLRKLVERTASPDARAAALVRLSELHGDAGEHDLAARAALEALAIEGPSGAAAERHRALITTGAGWAAHADALRAWLDDEREPPDSPTPGGAREAALEIARIAQDELKKPAQAVAVLERVARTNPADVEVRRTLAATLRRASRHDEALAELRSLLGEHVSRPELWQELGETFRAAGKDADAERALAPIALLEEKPAAPSSSPSARPGSLDASILEALYPTRRAGPLLALLRSATPALGKLYPADFDAFGVASKDRVSTRSPTPIRKALERVTQVFGTGELHLYLHRARGRGIAVELTAPPSILVPAAVAELGEAHQTFAIARAVANVAAGLPAVDKLTPRELEMVLAAVARRVAPGFGAGLTSEEGLTDIHKRFFRALPRRAKKDVEEAARAYVESEERDFAAVTEAVVASAQRVALLVADDLAASVEVLKRTERDLANLSGPRLLAHPTISRLLRFWLSPEADALRQRMGIDA